MKRAFGLDGAPAASTGVQSDQVLSGELVLPLRVATWTRSGFCPFQAIRPHMDIASVSRTTDSYVPDLAGASAILNSFPTFAVVAYIRLLDSISFVVCSSVDSTNSVTLREFDSESE